MNPIRATVAITLTLLAAGCGGLSRQAKEIVGDYYNPQLSSELPIYELKPDGTCTVRNIAPGVLVMEVSGTWDVTGDSLVIINDLRHIRLKGDTSIVGEIAPRVARKITTHDDHSLTLSQNGIDYLYMRHPHDHTR